MFPSIWSQEAKELVRSVHTQFIVGWSLLGWPLLAMGDIDSSAVIQENLRVGDREVSLVMFLFDEADYDMIVIDNGAERNKPLYSSLSEALEENDCVAGSNGGFFDVRGFSPHGLMVADGAETGVFDGSSWTRGYFWSDSEGRSELSAQEDYNADEGARDLFQSGPWLVRGGNQEAGFTNDTRPRRRTFIGRNSDGLWMIGICESCTLTELAALLVDDAVERHIDLDEALNLDGGPSTALRIGESIEVKGGWAVRNFLGIRAKR